jgi:hypothetical protein
MIASRSSRETRRDGNVAVTVAVSLVVIMSFAALSIDGGMLLDRRRHVQSTADAASLAGVSELYLNWWNYKGLDVNGAAELAARATASAAGYTHGVDGVTVEVYIPPQTGPNAGVKGYCEVIIGTQQSRHFSKIIGSSNVTVRGRSVARGRTSAIFDAIICLDPLGKSALNAGGGGTVSVTGAPIQVNSVHAEAMIANGNGTLKADEFDVGGDPGWATPGGGTFSGPIVSNSDPIPDPLANVPVPDPRTMTIQSHSKTVINKDTILFPGVYKKGITINGGITTLMPGIYYMDGGGFTLGGSGQLIGNGVMIYNAPQSNSDTISISGSNGYVTLSPMMDGPYQGLLFYQDRTSTAPVSVSGSAGCTMTITGTFYAASANLNVTGNGDQQTIGSQYISYRLNLQGNGTYNCIWSPDMTPGKRDFILVE